MLQLQTKTLGVMDTPERQHEYMLVVAMLDCVMRGRGDWMASVTSWFKPAWICDPYLQSLYEAIAAMACNKEPDEPATLLASLPADGSLFGKRMADLYGLWTDRVSQGGHVSYYANKVYDAYRRLAASAEIIDAGNEMASTPAPDTVFGGLVQLQKKYQPAPQRTVTGNRETYQEIIEELDGKRACVSAKFGVHVLDDAVQLRPGRLCTVAGLTSGGKSVLLGQVALNTANSGRVALLFTYEMSKNEVVQRWATVLSRQVYRMSDTGMWIGGDRKRWLEGLSCVERLESAGLLHVFDHEGRVESITARATAYAAVNDVGVIVVDYIQIVPPSVVHNVTREQQVSHVVNVLKRLAMQLQVPVVTASQLNDDGRLRESRDIANASDIVLKLEPKSQEPEPCDLSIRVDKNRSGAAGRILTVYWEKPLFNIRDKTEFDSEYDGGFK